MIYIGGIWKDSSSGKIMNYIILECSIHSQGLPDCQFAFLTSTVRGLWRWRNCDWQLRVMERRNWIAVRGFHVRKERRELFLTKTVYDYIEITLLSSMHSMFLLKCIYSPTKTHYAVTALEFIVHLWNYLVFYFFSITIYSKHPNKLDWEKREFIRNWPEHESKKKGHKQQVFTIISTISSIDHITHSSSERQPSSAVSNNQQLKLPSTKPIVYLVEKHSTSSRNHSILTFNSFCP